MKLSLCKECKETGARHAQSFARTLTLHKDLVQGVHIYEIQLSIEESRKENGMKARGISLREILWNLSYQIHEMQGVHRKSKSSRDQA
jgi:hypothetical protein